MVEFSRETEPIGCVYTHTHTHTHTHTKRFHISLEREKYMIYFKELAHLIVETGKFKICRVGQ